MIKIVRKIKAITPYLFTVCLIVMSIIIVVVAFGRDIKDFIIKCSCPVVNKTYIEGDRPGAGYCGTENDRWTK